MNEMPRSPRLNHVVAATLVAVMVAAGLAFSSTAASATGTGAGVASASSTLGTCKQKAVSACRKVTARTCRVKTTKRLRANGDRVSKRKVAKSCARKAKRHCASRAQKRKQAQKAARCVRGSKKRSTRPSRLRGAAQSTGVLPTGASTGVPAGTRLKVVRGDMTITRDGTVLSGLDVRGFVKIRANNVLIENTIIRGRALAAGQNGTLVQNWDGNTGLVIRDSSLIGMQAHTGLGGFKGRNTVLDRVEIAKVIDQIQVIGGSVSLTNSWLHSNLHLPDPNYSDGVSHDDNIQIEGGANIDVINNRIEGSYNAAIMVTQNHSRTSHVRVQDSYLAGGGCTINLSEKGKGPISPMSVVNNTFGQARHSNCAVIAPDSSRPTMSNNRWAASEGAVAVRRGG